MSVLQFDQVHCFKSTRFDFAKFLISAGVRIDFVFSIDISAGLWNLFFHDVFKFDKALDHFAAVCSSSCQNVQHLLATLPRSTSLLWCLLRCAILNEIALLHVSLDCILTVFSSKQLSKLIPKRKVSSLSLKSLSSFETKLSKTVRQLLKACGLLLYCPFHHKTFLSVLSSVVELTTSLPVYRRSIDGSTLIYGYEDALQFLMISLFSASISNCEQQPSNGVSPEVDGSMRIVANLCRNPKFRCLLADSLQSNYVRGSSIHCRVSLFLAVPRTLVGLSESRRDLVGPLQSLLFEIASLFPNLFFADTTGTLSTISGMTKSENDGIRATAAQFIGCLLEFNAPMSVSTSPAFIYDLGDILAQLSNDKCHTVRTASINASKKLSRIHDINLIWLTSMASQLVLLCGDSVGAVRGAAIGALGDISRSSAVPFKEENMSFFIKACEDSKLAVRIEAFWSLSKYIMVKWLPNVLFQFDRGRKSLSTSSAPLLFRRVILLLSHALDSDSDKLIPALLRGVAALLLGLSNNEMLQLSDLQWTEVLQLRNAVEQRIRKIHPSLESVLASKSKDVANAYSLILSVDLYNSIRFLESNNVSSKGEPSEDQILDSIVRIIHTESQLLQIQSIQLFLLLVFSSPDSVVVEYFKRDNRFSSLTRFSFTFDDDI